ncbi:MAG: hypothetical protein ACRDPW_08545 [Mycobacteriales bacterium]
MSLRTALRLDALASGALGALLLLLAGILDGLLGLPVLLSIVVGAALMMWAGFIVWVSGHLSAALVKEVIAFNAVWTVASVVFAFAGWVNLTGRGIAFVLVQAGAVGALTGLQLIGVQRARTAVPA